MHRVRYALVAAALLTSAALSAQQVFNLSGKWTYAVVTENGTGTPTITLKQSGDSLSGTYESSRMGELALSGAIKGDKFLFDVVTSGGTTMTFDGSIVDKDHVKGSVSYDGEPGPSFTGERQK